MTVKAEDLVRIRARIHGRVQGVYFRASTCELAKKLDLRGWVRNRVDGSVELEAEGDTDAVDQLLAFVRVGPRGAEVKEVEVENVPPTAGEDQFAVLRTAP